VGVLVRVLSVTSAAPPQPPLVSVMPCSSHSALVGATNAAPVLKVEPRLPIAKNTLLATAAWLEVALKGAISALKVVLLPEVSCGSMNMSLESLLGNEYSVELEADGNWYTTVGVTLEVLKAVSGSV